MNLNGGRSIKGTCEYEVFKETSGDCSSGANDYIVESYYGFGGPSKAEVDKARTAEMNRLNSTRKIKSMYLSCPTMYTNKCK